MHWTGIRLSTLLERGTCRNPQDEKVACKGQRNQSQGREIRCCAKSRYRNNLWAFVEFPHQKACVNCKANQRPSQEQSMSKHVKTLFPSLSTTWIYLEGVALDPIFLYASGWEKPTKCSCTWMIKQARCCSIFAVNLIWSRKANSMFFFQISWRYQLCVRSRCMCA